MQEEIKSNFTGSKKTLELVASQIKERYGVQEAEKYDPYSNCLTYNEWKNRGYAVKKGEKAIRSYTYVGPKDDDENDDVPILGRRYQKPVFLFYYLQVQPINS